VTTSPEPCSAGFAVRYVRNWRAFPFTFHSGEDDSITVTVHPHGLDGGGMYEFQIVHTGKNNRSVRSPIGVRVALFSDSWRAFDDLPQFFKTLADLDTSKGLRSDDPVDLDVIETYLSSLGWEDITDDYAPRRATDDHQPTDQPTGQGDGS
jgi:hypothetical protein